MTKPVSAPRAAALIGPFSSGKTTLLESLLFVSGSLARKGGVKDGTSAGDASPEARQHQMSVEPNIAGTTYLEDRWCFIDCPGSVEFLQDSYNVLRVVDAAVVVVEPDPARAVMVAPFLKFLDDHKIPHFLFLNKMDDSKARLRETLEALQAVSERPLVLREIPMLEGDKVVGHVDLVSERAWRWREGKPSDLVKLPERGRGDEMQARQEMLEHLADFDDHLLEELLEDTIPATDEIYQNLTRDFHQDLIVPVFFGSALSDHGVRRLLKALRHEVPEYDVTAARLGLGEGGPSVAQVFKTIHAQHTGKLSFARVLRGAFVEGETVGGAKLSGLLAPQGVQLSKQGKAEAGEVVAFPRLDSVATGDTVGAIEERLSWPAPLAPLFALAVQTARKADEVKLTTSLVKLIEEDPSLSIEQNPETGEILLWGQGEIHLMVAMERLKNRFNLEVLSHRPQVPYKETIRKSTSVHGRHKRQTGGHGQFGDVYLDIAPLPRGEGFAFIDKIVGGVIPRQYIPSVEEGVKDYLRQGPLGFPVVDVAVTLTNGSFHSVDSSDMAFKTAARIAMTEGMPNCDPVLLEPILAVEISVPTEHTSKVQRIVSGRRGQILGYDAKPGWKGWDSVSACLPQAEMADLIIELRSLTMGVGTFAWRFDHLQEVMGRQAQQVIGSRRAALAS
ncbi:elongation factor G [Telmatospirillum sp. J64-1]|uniref:elongation factor G n=1 Tax=Telmatospirillum sp. J64-1 TaxID=2502183 RepID=UPI00115E0D61|nr:elongation factor G [Telmatospirillum sp. J64-1]